MDESDSTDLNEPVRDRVGCSWFRIILLSVNIGFSIDFVFEKKELELPFPNDGSFVDIESIKAKEDFNGFIACINSVAPERQRLRTKQYKKIDEKSQRKRGRKGWKKIKEQR